MAHSSRTPRPDAAARADLRPAARERRRFERAEVRRFTRRARTRRLGVAVVAGTVVTMIGLVLGAIFSPVLALREIRVDGTLRVSSADVLAAVDSQLGTPLALLDYGKITGELGAFALIRSYVTEIVPPDTLVIHIVERQPVGSMLVNGSYNLVDPAGVTVERSAERTVGVPLIEIGTAAASSAQFDAVVAVLVSLPPSLLAQVDVAS
ncbi:MAG: FtsQ-type POTRA domain-containing protein, partial [Rhodoglobus sp.]